MGSEHSEAQLSIRLSSIQPNRSTFLSRNASTATREQLKSLGWKFKQVTNTQESTAAKSCCLNAKPGDFSPHQPSSTHVPRTPGCQREPTLATPCSVCTPARKTLQPKRLPASGVCRPLRFSPLPRLAGPRLTPAHRRQDPGLLLHPSLHPQVPGARERDLYFSFVIKRLYQKLSTDPERMSKQ